MSNSLRVLPSLQQIEQAARTVYEHLSPTPQINWPLLDEHCRCEVWLKHENHLPTGSFKVRGGVWFAKDVVTRADERAVNGLITATRGNHGQSIAFAAKHFHLNTTIVVPENNNPEKNEAMKAYGAKLIMHGRGFEEAQLQAEKIAKQRELLMVPSFDPILVCGVATYALELFNNAPSLDRVYVPIGLGSGICGVVAVKEALKLDTEIVGVVAANANAYQQSFEAKSHCRTESAETIADGLAVTYPDATALSIVLDSVARVISVSDEEIAAAMKALFVATHNLAEGAGAAALAGLIKDNKSGVARSHSRSGVILSGGNVAFDTLSNL